VLTDSEKIGVSLPVRAAPNDPEPIQLGPFSSFRSIEEVAIGRVGRTSRFAQTEKPSALRFARFLSMGRQRTGLP
jgi:hypothetical protein